MPRLLKFVCFIACLSVSLWSYGQSSKYPDKSIELVVLFPVGSSSDVVARIFADNLSKELGVPIVVNNKPGAGGNIGAEIVSKSAPDGYTWLMASVGTHGINLPLYTQGGGKLPYDPIKDFTPITLVARSEEHTSELQSH